jgi:hypothetical protein
MIDDPSTMRTPWLEDKREPAMRRTSKETDAWRLEERRKEARYTLILRAGLLEQEGRSFFCLVRNISVSGAELKFYSRPTLDVDAVLCVADEPPVKGTIAWINQDKAGISFHEELDATTLLRVRQKLSPNRRRAIPRMRVDASASVRTASRTCRAVVCDISSLGARVRTDPVLAAGDRAVVEFTDLPTINAYVRWTDGEESGLIFETPIPMQIIAHWIEGRARVIA